MRSHDVKIGTRPVKDCPVCGKVGLVNESTTCPQCNADLACFDLLAALHEEENSQQAGPDWIQEFEKVQLAVQGLQKTQGQPAQRRVLRRYGLLLLFVGIFCGVMLYQNVAFKHQFDQEMAFLATQIKPIDTAKNQWNNIKFSERIMGMNQRLDQLEKKLTTTSTKLEAAYQHFSTAVTPLSQMAKRLVVVEQKLSRPISATVTTSKQTETAPNSVLNKKVDAFFYYNPKDGDTLWDIAKKYYGSGHFFPVLLAYNPGLGVYYSRHYGKIKVLQDRQKAQKIVDELVLFQKNGAWYRYQVIEGDTWKRLSRRFFGHPNQATKLKRSNPKARLVPGESVLVPL